MSAQASRVAGWAWVAVQAVLILALIAAPPSKALHAPLAFGWVLFGLGLIIFGAAMAVLGHAFTPNPVPKENARLVGRGIYRFVRHPMYTAVLVCALGWSLAHGAIWHYGVSLAMWVFFYAKSSAEERWLMQRHPHYADYRASAGRFMPKVFPRRDS
jgi:protein-S-isoprenylcysteine O-methyltransferase Ste14